MSHSHSLSLFQSMQFWMLRIEEEREKGKVRKESKRRRRSSDEAQQKNNLDA